MNTVLNTDSQPKKKADDLLGEARKKPSIGISEAWVKLAISLFVASCTRKLLGWEESIYFLLLTNLPFIHGGTRYLSAYILALL